MNLRRQIAGLLVGLAATLSLFTAVLSAAPNTTEIALCVGNAAAVDRVLAQAWEEELRRILDASGRQLRMTACGQDQTVEIHFFRLNPVESSALGAARTRRGHVLPSLEVYTEPVAALIGTRLPGLLGKAMARVTAHELTHFLRQAREHDDAGAFSGQYTAGLLLAARPSYFGVR